MTTVTMASVLLQNHLTGGMYCLNLIFVCHVYTTLDKKMPVLSLQELVNPRLILISFLVYMYRTLIHPINFFVIQIFEIHFFIKWKTGN